MEDYIQVSVHRTLRRYRLRSVSLLLYSGLAWGNCAHGFTDATDRVTVHRALHRVHIRSVCRRLYTGYRSGHLSQNCTQVTYQVSVHMALRRIHTRSVCIWLCRALSFRSVFPGLHRHQVSVKMASHGLLWGQCVHSFTQATDQASVHMALWRFKFMVVTIDWTEKWWEVGGKPRQY